MDDFRPRQQPSRPLSVPPRTSGQGLQPVAQQSSKPLQQARSQSAPQPPLTSAATPSLPRAIAPPSLDLGDAPKGPEKPLKVHKKRSRKWLWITIPLVIVGLLIIAVFSGLAWYNDALQAKSSDENPVKMEVQSGASIDQVAQELEEKSIIKSALAFSLYMKFSGHAVIKTGSYLFAPNQRVSEIVQWLNDGKVSTRRVTILPGQTLKQIAETLVKDGFTAESVTAAFAKKYEHKVLADKPADANLEGYLFPETYFVTIDSSPEELITTALDEFEKRIDEDNLRAKLQARGFSLYQGITLASIITKEVTKVEDQQQVSQVFQTRLAKGIMLGSDVTYHYAADMLGVERSVNIDSPYNTRIHTGLPPGPIGNFNLSALVAVAEPAQGDYLFFVAGDDGVTHFSRTIEEHEQNIQKYCQKLCSEA